MRIVRYIAIALNAIIWVLMIVSFVWSAVENGIADFKPVYIFVVIFPLLNILALLDRFHPILRVVLTMAALSCHTAVVAFAILMIFWPLGSKGQGWSLVLFWSFCVVVALIEIALILRIGEVFIKLKHS